MANIRALVVGAGGGGPITYSYATGGGGGGGVLEVENHPIARGQYSVTIGQGVAGGIGGNSVLDSLIAYGGGNGGCQSPNIAASSGGSGGGGSNSIIPGTGIAGQGYDGGSSYIEASGGGGGAGGVGGNATIGGGGNGGIGKISTILDNTNRYYGGGGGGSLYNGGVGTGGLGGGGNGRNDYVGNNGTANTGGGGGGGASSTLASSGGSGIVIVRYPITNFSGTGGIITTVGSDEVIQFLSSGTLSLNDPIVTSYLGSNDDYENGGTSGARAQSFQVPVTTNITSISFYGSRGSLYAGTTTVEIRSGSADGTLLGSKTVSSSSFSEYGSPAWNSVFFDAGIPVSPGTTYFLIMRHPSGASGDEVRWSTDTTSPGYANGSAWYYSTNWTESATRDKNFRIHGSNGIITHNAILFGTNF